MRVVLDTNVIISALLKLNSPPAMIVRLWRSGDIELAICEQAFVEVMRVIQYDRLKRWMPSPDAIASDFSSTLLNYATWHTVEVNEVDSVVRDPNDQFVLALTRISQPDYVISGDKDLLVLGEYSNVPIITPAQFLEIFDTLNPPTALPESP